jgi:hypothetical protein
MEHVCPLAKALMDTHQDFRNITKNDHFAHIPQGGVLHGRLRSMFRLGSSEFGPALGVSKVLSRRQLHDRKHGNWAPSEYATRMMAHGKKAERPAFDLCKSWFKTYNPNWSLQETGTWVFAKQALEDASPSLMDYCCTPDGIVWEGGDIVATLEIKCPFGDTVYQDLLSDTIILKPDHYIQVQSQILATGCKGGYYACYTPDKTLLIYIPASSPQFMKWVFTKVQEYCQSSLCPSPWLSKLEGEEVYCDGWSGCQWPRKYKTNEKKMILNYIQEQQINTPAVLIATISAGTVSSKDILGGCTCTSLAPGFQTPLRK